MLECLVIGDSLAVGVGQARPECVTLAQTGITSASYLKTVLPGLPREARHIVISLGVNDDPTVPTLDNLRVLRRSLRGQAVIWLLPGLKDEVRQAIQIIARESGDRTIDTQPQVGPDHLHPTGQGYRVIASLTQDPAGPRGGPAEARRFAAIANPLATGAAGPNMSGNLRQYRESPVVIYPYTFNNRVIYGLPANSFAALRPPTPRLGMTMPRQASLHP